MAWKELTVDEMLDAIASSKSMAEAARLLDLSYKTFKRCAVKHGIFVTNQSGKDVAKGGGKYTEEDILSGNNELKSNELKKRLFNLGLKDKRCEWCNLTVWNELPITLELDHIDGDDSNNKLSNLRCLCPNCHSQTPTWRGRNKNRGRNRVSDEALAAAILEEGNIRQALKKLGYAAKGANYVRAKRVSQTDNK